jgi:hypothetical protein
MQRSASEWWQDRSAGEGLSPPVEAASEPTDALEKHMDEALVIETQRASPSRGRPEKGNQVVDTQSLPTVTRIDQLASIMVSTGKTFVEWPSLLVVKTEGFTEERHAPWFLPATLVANVALFVGVCCANDCPGQEGEGGLARRCVGASVLHQCSFEPRDINPLLGPRKETLLRLVRLNPVCLYAHSCRTLEKISGFRIIAVMWGASTDPHHCRAPSPPGKS